MNVRRIALPLTGKICAELRAGDAVYLSGVLYSARDAAHKRFIEMLDAGKPLPFPPEGACLYYMGPSPAAPGQVIGAAGPTTSSRMDAYTPRLLGLGVLGMIGKGDRSAEVAEAMMRAGAVYFGALGGGGALLSDRIKKAEEIAFPDLGPEAVRRLVVEEFPVVVVIDCLGNNLYRSGREAYLKSLGKP
ncbi:MAG: Fe-S-containing hydro-lyase [Treponema sp.]|jgi:fumarate hydratase subunit beta|nr:Fe-S-containing hydro-lyase [Treponema sp.]